MADFLRPVDRDRERSHPLPHHFGDAVADPARPPVELGCRRHEEATPPEHLALGVREPRVAETPQAREASLRRKSRAQHLLDEDGPRRLHGGELEVLLGAEVCEQAALAHLELGRQPAYRQAFETVGRSDVNRDAKDRLAGPVAANASPVEWNADRVYLCHTKLIARSFVLCQDLGRKRPSDAAKAPAKPVLSDSARCSTGPKKWLPIQHGFRTRRLSGSEDQGLSRVVRNAGPDPSLKCEQFLQ